MSHEHHMDETLLNHIQSLPAEHIKQVMVRWFQNGEINLDSLEETLNHENGLFDGRKEHEQELTPAEKIQALDDWISNHSSNAPPLSDEAISRESIYSHERL